MGKVVNIHIGKNDFVRGGRRFLVPFRILVIGVFEMFPPSACDEFIINNGVKLQILVKLAYAYFCEYVFHPAFFVGKSGGVIN